MEWYYAQNDQRLGPVSEQEFSVLLQNGTVTPQTYVWRKGLENWVQYGTLPETAPQAMNAPDLTASTSLADELLIGDIAGAGMGLLTCAECGEFFDSSEVIAYQGQYVCGPCKPIYFQRIKEGGTRANVFEYGGFWIRFVAKFIDGIIQQVVTYGTMFIIGMLMSGAFDAENEPGGGFLILTMLITWGFPMVYSVFFLGKFGATPGKMALGLKVVRSDGDSITYLRAFGRYFAEMLSTIIFLIGYIMAAFDDEKRTLHDRICDTRVIKT